MTRKYELQGRVLYILGVEDSRLNFTVMHVCWGKVDMLINNRLFHTNCERKAKFI